MYNLFVIFTLSLFMAQLQHHDRLAQHDVWSHRLTDGQHFLSGSHGFGLCTALPHDQRVYVLYVIPPLSLFLLYPN